MTEQATANAPHASRRTRFLLAVFLFWGTVVVVKLAQLMLINRDQYLTEMTRRSVYVGHIPARRGRLLDRDGRVLAWSSRHLRLLWDVPPDIVSASRDWHLLKTACKELPVWSGDDIRDRLGTRSCVLDDVTLRSVTSPEQLMAIRGVRLESYFARHYCSAPEVVLALGQVTLIDGAEVGVSGAEKTHDALLRGRPSSYRVMVDKHGEWIPETWRKTDELRPGFDVHLPASYPSVYSIPTWSRKPSSTPAAAAGG